jgi:hypothetical protein
MITFVITHTSPSEEHEKFVRRWIMIECDGQKDKDRLEQTETVRHKNIVKKDRHRQLQTDTGRERERKKDKERQR